MADYTKYNRIKAELAEAGKTNQQLARYMNVYDTTVSDWCTNKNQPAIQDLYRIAEFLDIDVRRLLVATIAKQSSLAAEDAGLFVKKKEKPAKRNDSKK